jgi:hypothetical protein
MRKKSPTLVCRLSMSLTTKTTEHVVPAYNLPRGRAVDRGKVAEAAQKTAQAEAPHAALAAQATAIRTAMRLQDEAGRIAVNIARLPELIRKP